MNMKWRECLCLRSPEPEESDNVWMPEPILSESSGRRQSSVTYNTSLKAEEETLLCSENKLRCSPNKEVFFHGESETVMSFSERLSSTPLFTMTSERQLKTPGVRYPSNPRLLSVNLPIVPYPYSPGFTPGNSTSSWVTIKNMQKMESETETVERDSEDSEVTQQSIIFTPNRDRAIRKNSTPIQPTPIYLESLDPKTSDVKLDPTKEIGCQKGRPIVVVDSVTDSSLTPFNSSRNSDFGSGKSSKKNSLYSNDSSGTNESIWATFVPLTPESGKHSSNSSTVETFSEPSYLDLQMLESDYHDEFQMNENSKPSKGSGVVVEEVYTISSAHDNLERILV